MFRTILCSHQANSGKNTEINQQLRVKFWFNRKKMELSQIYLDVKDKNFELNFFCSSILPKKSTKKLPNFSDLTH